VWTQSSRTANECVAENLSLGKPARQISTYTDARNAVDGDVTTNACSYADDPNPWWAVDLGQDYDIGDVKITSPETEYYEYYDGEIDDYYGNYTRFCSVHEFISYGRPM